MTLRTILYAGAAAAALISGGANAATIVLIDQGGVKGSAAEKGFNIAAAYWGATLSNNIEIRLGVSYASLGAGIIGSTGSAGMDYTVAAWEAGVNATKSNSAIDANIVLPTLSTGTAAQSGAVSFITNGPSNTTTNRGINTAVVQYDTDRTGLNATDNKILYLNTANVKAIGGTAVYNNNPNSQAYNPDRLDGEVAFSNTFGFDFDPTDGISANTFDFIGTAIHEIGHALGFVSGVDFLDYFGGPRGPGRTIGLNYNFDQTSVYSALDMFRYSSDPTNIAPGTGPVLDLSVGTASYFSIDGGLTQFNGDSRFSTGAYNGDRQQASHWKDSPGCNPQLGIMDPTECYATVDEVKALDLAAFDAIGYNLALDSRSAGYIQTTAQIYNRFNDTAVPEPMTWSMMIMGFGLVGGTMRRRATRTRVSFAV